VSDVVSPVLVGREREPARTRAAVDRAVSGRGAGVHVSTILATLSGGGRVEGAGVAHRLGVVPPS
jgi:hypothetical protein